MRIRVARAYAGIDATNDASRPTGSGLAAQDSSVALSGGG
jgi:hypothetical protein